jgi:hypothetical protein
MGLANRPLPYRLLNVGPCPGLWRTYYSAVTEPPRHSRALAGQATYLNRHTSSTSEDGLGTDVERWVNEANRAAMEFIGSGAIDLGVFDQIQTPDLRAFYRARGEALTARRLSPQALSTLAMTINQPLTVFPDLPLSAPQPDGVFTNFNPGAIFESKLADPRGDSLFRASIAAYALVAEQHHHHAYDLGVLLHCGWPDSVIGVYAFPIDDADAGKILFNLERLRQLVDISRVRWTSTRHGKGRGSKPQTWEQLLVRPRARKPEREKLGPCPQCRFKPRCWSEGGWD